MDLRIILPFIFTGVIATNSTDLVPDNVFNGVYSECFLHLSYSCLQRKTLLYLKELNNLSEVSVLGDYVMFVKVNKSDAGAVELDGKDGNSEELAFRIDEAVDDFFDSHVLRFYALGRNVTMPRNEAFVGRKRKGGGGGGGGGHGGGGHGGEDGGKKKMMMMAMMCMKMKLMMMVPAMMGMMGMMSFKGMMFSMMSFMISKMMLLMKILEKKGGGGGGGAIGGGGDGGWAAGGGGGAWMPAGGQDYGGGGGGGYDANGQWQSRSIVDTLRFKTNKPITPVNHAKDAKIWVKDDKTANKGDNTFDRRGWNELAVLNPDETPNVADNLHQFEVNGLKAAEISFVKPVVTYNNAEKELQDPVLVYKKSNVDLPFDDSGSLITIPKDVLKRNVRIKRDAHPYNNFITNKLHKLPIVDENFLNYDYNDALNDKDKTNKTRRKRSIVDLIQNSYIYWVNKVLGINNNRRTNVQKYKIVNGIKYVYYPYRMQKIKMPKVIQPSVTQSEDLKPMIAVEDFNKGEIVEGGVESRMNKKKFNKMKDTVNDALEENPWE